MSAFDALHEAFIKASLTLDQLSNKDLCRFLCQRVEGLTVFLHWRGANRVEQRGPVRVVASRLAHNLEGLVWIDTQISREPLRNRETP